MRKRFSVRNVRAAVFGLLAIGTAAHAQPDVIVGDLTGPRLWGTLDGKSAYSLGTTSCNIGDENLLWDDTTFDGTPANLHPVIGQNMFRLKDGRFEQIGQSWLKHAFCALQLSGLCDTCQPAGGGCTDELGPGCHDPYGASLNGSQTGLGAKFEINAATGEYPWPYTGRGTSGNTLFKRIQVDNDDLDPSLNPDARYFGEGQYVAPDDAQAGNDNNNASYRELRVFSFNNGWNVGWTGQTQREKPAIQAWADVDPDVTVVNVDVENDGRLIVAYKVTENQDGTYHYEYAIQNLNSDRSVDGVFIPVGDGAEVSSIGFHDVDYHSGEPFDNTDWNMSESNGAVEWTSPATFAQDPDTNALRWGTLYNFRFDASTPPVEGQVELSLFKPGTPNAIAFTGLVPEGTGCPADLTGPSGDGVPDGALTSDDFFFYLQLFANGDLDADLTNPLGGKPDGSLTADDFFFYLGLFAQGCP